MLKQEYSSKNLSKIIRHKHVFMWNMWHNNSEKNRVLQEYAEKINESEQLLGEIIVQKFNGKNTYRPQMVEDFLMLKLTNYFIKRIYKVSQVDRKTIIKQIRTILLDGSPYKLLKLDITDFYESIALEKMIDKLKEDMLLGGKGITILESLRDKIQTLPLQYRTFGLPRGIDISATLSELFMTKLDDAIKRLDGVFFYARYVDDIIIIHTTDEKLLGEKCSSIISTYDLTINTAKRQSIIFQPHNNDKQEFDFLGYRFRIESTGDDAKEKKIIIDIADKKINKLKKRIARAFIAYLKDRDFPMLKRRLRFLSGVVRLQASSQGVLRAGNALNYSELTSSTSLRLLDGYIRTLLSRNKSRLEKLLSPLFSETQKDELLKISFLKGYENHLAMNYSRNQASKIKKTWNIS